MFQNAVALNKAQHQQLRFVPQKSFAFAAREQAIPIIAHEAQAAAEEFVIVFPEEGAGLPLLLTGVQTQVNAYVDAEGRWLAKYVPAQVRRYPFALAEHAPQGAESDARRSFTLCVVPDAPHFTSDEEGWELFGPGGTLSAGLVQAQAQLADVQGNAELTQFLVQQIADAGLLSTQSVPVLLGQGRVLGVQGFRVVDLLRFQAMETPVKEQLRESGALALLESHLRSLKNLGADGVLAKAARPADAQALPAGEKLFDAALLAAAGQVPAQQAQGGKPAFEAKAFLASAGLSAAARSKG